VIVVKYILFLDQYKKEQPIRFLDVDFQQF